MKKMALLNIFVVLVTLCSLVSCDSNAEVTDDKGVVTAIEATNIYGKKYKANVRIVTKSKYTYYFEYTLYTNKSYRVGDSIFIK
jgi:hypothetical protein